MNPSIIRTGGLSKILWNVDQVYLDPCHRGIIQPYLDIFRALCNACICRNLPYSESWNIQSPSIITYRRIFKKNGHINENIRIFSSLTYLKPDTYSEPSQRFNIEFFAKIVRKHHYFSKVIHHRSLTEFWIGLSLNKYWLTCEVTSRYVLYDIYSVNSNIFRHIHILLRYIEPYCGIFRTLCTTLAHSESCHIQSPAIFRT